MTADQEADALTTEQRRRLRLSRDSVIFLLGVAGIIYETVGGGGERPTLIILFGACLGLPAFLHADARLKSKPDEPPADPPPIAQPPVGEP